jgi:anti-sigma regulatory factor (Ser/Thr protein kinase)
MTTRTVLGTITLPAIAENIGRARHFATRLLAGSPLVESAELLISEACTNSVRHSRSREGGTFTLILIDVSGTLRCEVIDSGGPTVPVRRNGAEPRDNGYGVLLIETLSSRSGHYTDDAGRLHTWFEFD